MKNVVYIKYYDILSKLTPKSSALLVKEMSEIMGVNLNENDVLIAHRLPPTEKVKDRLIVKLLEKRRAWKRDEIYSKRKNLKSKRTKDLPSAV